MSDEKSQFRVGTGGGTHVADARGMKDIFDLPRGDRWQTECRPTAPAVSSGCGHAIQLPAIGSTPTNRPGISKSGWPSLALPSCALCASNRIMMEEPFLVEITSSGRKKVMSTGRWSSATRQRSGPGAHRASSYPLSARHGSDRDSAQPARPANRHRFAHEAAHHDKTAGRAEPAEPTESARTW